MSDKETVETKPTSSNKAIITLIIAGVVVVSAGIYAASVRNNFVNLEERLDAKNEDTKNVYASISNSLKTQGLAVEKYNDTVIKAIEAAISGRYGKDGSQAAMQWIQENNPTIDPAITQKLMAVIEANYQKFETAQTEKLDIVREYKTQLRVFPNNIIAGIFDYPTKDLKEIGKVITNAATTKAFETGEAEAIDPFSSEKK